LSGKKGKIAETFTRKTQTFEQAEEKLTWEKSNAKEDKGKKHAGGAVEMARSSG